MSRSARTFAALLLPLVLLLASCKSTNAVDISADGGVTMTMDMVDEEGMAVSSERCELIVSPIVA